MGVLAMLELDGETKQLLGAMERLERLLPAPDGLVARMVAPTPEGVVLFQLWESQDARERNHKDPAHAAALEASGIRGLMRGSRSRSFEGVSLSVIQPQERR
jgi:hypothetical protein